MLNIWTEEQNQFRLIGRANQLTGGANQRVSSEIRTARRTEDSHFKKSVSTKQNKQQYCLEIPQSREENLMIQEQSF